ILNANANAGPDTITFAIGTGAQTINLLSPLPAITDRVTIDGTTQPGYAGRPIIELNGAATGPSACGLTLNAGNSTVKGLVLNRFTTGPAVCVNSNVNVIQGSWIGLNAQGSGSGMANLDGITVTGSGNLIGGTTEGAGNVISANNRYGVAVVGS